VSSLCCTCTQGVSSLCCTCTRIKGHHTQTPMQHMLTHPNQHTESRSHVIHRYSYSPVSFACAPTACEHMVGAGKASTRQGGRPKEEGGLRRWHRVDTCGVDAIATMFQVVEHHCVSSCQHNLAVDVEELRLSSLLRCLQEHAKSRSGAMRASRGRSGAMRAWAARAGHAGWQEAGGQASKTRHGTSRYMIRVSKRLPPFS
jgi:hypothetical protein